MTSFEQSDVIFDYFVEDQSLTYVWSEGSQFFLGGLVADDGYFGYLAAVIDGKSTYFDSPVTNNDLAEPASDFGIV